MPGLAPTVMRREGWPEAFPDELEPWLTELLLPVNIEPMSRFRLVEDVEDEAVVGLSLSPRPSTAL